MQTYMQQACSKQAASMQQVFSKHAASMQQACSNHASTHTVCMQHASEQATCSRHGFCHGSGAAELRRSHASLSSQMCLTLTTAASACWPATPASLSSGGECYNHLLLNSRAASPLRAYAILNYTLGVGQTRLRGVGFAAIRFCH